MTIIALYSNDAATYNGDRADWYSIADIDTSLNDARYRRLVGSGYLGPHVNDMLVEWLTDYIVGLGGTVVNDQLADLWLQMLELYTASTGARNDLMFEWLTGLGYQIASLPDMLWDFWNDPTELPNS